MNNLGREQFSKNSQQKLGSIGIIYFVALVRFGRQVDKFHLTIAGFY